MARMFSSRFPEGRMSEEESSECLRCHCKETENVLIGESMAKQATAQEVDFIDAVISYTDNRLYRQRLMKLEESTFYEDEPDPVNDIYNFGGGLL